MRVAPYKVVGFRRTSAGRIALVAEFLLPDGESMTDLGKLASAAADHLEAYAKQLATPAAKPVITGDAEDAAQLDRIAAALTAIAVASGQAGKSPPASGSATASPISTGDQL